MDADDFKVEAYGTVTPPPEDGEPDEGDQEEDEDD